MSKTPQYINATTVKKKKSTGEWRVKAYDQYGNRMKKADYFTDDKQDAEDTAVEMRLQGQAEHVWQMTNWHHFRLYVGKVLMRNVDHTHLRGLRGLVLDLDYEGQPICGGIYQSLHQEWEAFKDDFQDLHCDWDWSILQDWAMNSYPGLCPDDLSDEVLNTFG